MKWVFMQCMPPLFASVAFLISGLHPIRRRPARWRRDYTYSRSKYSASDRPATRSETGKPLSPAINVLERPRPILRTSEGRPTRCVLARRHLRTRKTAQNNTCCNALPTGIVRSSDKTNERELSDIRKDSRRGGVTRYSTYSQLAFGPAGAACRFRLAHSSLTLGCAPHELGPSLVRLWAYLRAI
jgi:hypothetical protein